MAAALALALTVSATHGRPPVALPDAPLESIEGKPARLSDYRGRVILLELWASWCDDCRASVPRLKALRERYAHRGFEIVAVSESERRKTVAAFVKKNALPYPVLLDSDSSMLRALGARGIPAAFLVDRSGNIRFRWVGPLPGPPEVENAVDSLLAEPTPK